MEKHVLCCGALYTRYNTKFTEYTRIWAYAADYNRMKPIPNHEQSLYVQQKLISAQSNIRSESQNDVVQKELRARCDVYEIVYWSLGGRARTLADLKVDAKGSTLPWPSSRNAPGISGRISSYVLWIVWNPPELVFHTLMLYISPNGSIANEISEMIHFSIILWNSFNQKYITLEVWNQSKCTTKAAESHIVFNIMKSDWCGIKSHLPKNHIWLKSCNSSP